MAGSSSASAPARRLAAKRRDAGAAAALQRLAVGLGVCVDGAEIVGGPGAAGGGDVLQAVAVRWAGDRGQPGACCGRPRTAEGQTGAAGRQRVQRRWQEGLRTLPVSDTDQQVCAGGWQLLCRGHCLACPRGGEGGRGGSPLLPMPTLPLRCLPPPAARPPPPQPPCLEEAALRRVIDGEHLAAGGG